MLTLQNYVGNVQRNPCRSSLSSALLQMANLQAYLTVRRSPAKFTGYILKPDGKSPLGGATVEIAGISTKTGRDGRFEITVPGKLAKEEGLVLSVQAEGYEASRDTVFPRSSEIGIALKRARQ